VDVAVVVVRSTGLWWHAYRRQHTTPSCSRAWRRRRDYESRFCDGRRWGDRCRLRNDVTRLQSTSSRRHLRQVRRLDELDVGNGVLPENVHCASKKTRHNFWLCLQQM